MHFAKSTAIFWSVTLTYRQGRSASTKTKIRARFPIPADGQRDGHPAERMAQAVGRATRLDEPSDRRIAHATVASCPDEAEKLWIQLALVLAQRCHIAFSPTPRA